MNFVLIELLVFGLPLLGFAVWQYVSVSRELERDKERDTDAD